MKNYIYTILILSFTLIGCELKPFDDIEPKYKLTVETAFTDVGKMESHLNGVYLTWRKFDYPQAFLFVYGGIATYTRENTFESNSLDYTDRDVVAMYRTYYELLQRANFLIYGLQSNAYIEGLDDDRRAEIEGETKLQRAMAHFALLRIFGQSWDLNSNFGVVVNMEPQTDPDPKARNTVQETYDAILSDLDFAIANAPIASVPWKMSQITAKGVKAQVLLTMNDYSGAAQMASEVMQDGNYKLEDDYGDIFTNGYESKEFLFSPYSNGKTDIGLDIWRNFLTSEALTQLADSESGAANDGNIATGAGFDTRFAYDNATDFLPSGRDHGKYPYKSATDKKGSSFHILRLAEVYLIYAEAKARLGTGVDTEALVAINAIRLRSNMPEKAPATKAALIEAIRIEKIMELFMEWAQPWHDMVRYHKLGDINITDYRPNITDDSRLIWPIPLKAIEANNKLVQNPGYAVN